MPEMPPDEEPLLHARRLVAQQCLYGVDKNPFAVSLAKLSLWLVTLARDHAFTFIDHALKHGDSLVGLTRKQIAAFHWKTKASDQIDWIEEQTRQDLEAALGWRNTLQELDEGNYNQKSEAWREAENALVSCVRSCFAVAVLVTPLHARRLPVDTGRSAIVSLWVYCERTCNSGH